MNGLKNEIPRPNLDLVLIDSIQTRNRLLKEFDESPEEDLMNRIMTLEKFIHERSQNQIVPPEYRPRFYRRRELEPIGYAHEGVNFNFPFSRR